MKILITGHKGFVGRYFMKKYEGHDITGVDIVDGNDARDFFKADNTKFDLVIHLAAVVGGRATIEGQPLSVAVDLSIDAEMFQWALRTRPGRVVYFSSSAAYPIEYQTKAPNLPNVVIQRKLAEDDINLSNIKNPDLTYGWSKLTGEYLASFAEADGLKVNVFRPFSGYGTDQDLSYPFPSFIERGKRKANPFEVWGDGEQVRDFIHIRDVVDAVDAAIANDITGPVNLGSGVATSFNELAAMVMAEAGYKGEIAHLPAAPVGVTYRVCHPNKMLSFYTPKISLEEGIRNALNGVL